MALAALSGACDFSSIAINWPTPTPDPTPIPSTGDNQIVTLTFARHMDQPFTGEQVDSVLDVASGLMQQDDGECDDVACPIEFQRSGEVRSFGTASSMLTTESQLDAVFAEPEDFKIVSLMIGVCGATSPDDVGVILGCAIYGQSVVITHGAAPDVWAHEWGHVLGLNHRDDCARNIMHSLAPDTNAVTSSECSVFLRNQPALFAGLLRASTPISPEVGATAASWPMADPSAVPGAGFESRLRVPWPASDLRPAATGLRAADLLDELAVARTETARLNLARALGFAGDAQAIPALMAVVDARAVDPSPDELAVCAEALLAIGRLSVADTDGTGLQYLLNLAASGLSAAEGGADSAAAGETPAPAVPLARLSVLALGVSGHPEAAAFLDSWQARLAAARATPLEWPSEISAARAWLRGSADAAMSPADTFRQP